MIGDDKEKELDWRDGRAWRRLIAVTVVINIGFGKSGQRKFGKEKKKRRKKVNGGGGVEEERQRSGRMDDGIR